MLASSKSAFITVSISVSNNSIFINLSILVLLFNTSIPLSAPLTWQPSFIGKQGMSKQYRY